jgi:hypothetical protein
MLERSVTINYRNAFILNPIFYVQLMDGSIGNVSGQRFWDPGSTLAGVEVFLYIEFKKNRFFRNVKQPCIRFIGVRFIRIISDFSFHSSLCPDISP